MALKSANIKEQFISGLLEYLHFGTEAALTKAYEHGRKSLQYGAGELEIVEVYHEALFEIQDREIILDSEEKFKQASAFLREWLAPYEVRLKGYKDLIEALNEKNDLLEKEIETRVQAETDLQKSKDHFQSLIENAQDIITVLDYNGIIQYSSPSVERLLNYGQFELNGENAFDYVHPNDIDHIKKLFEEVVDTPGHVESEEFRFKHKNGSWVYLESIAKNVYDKADGPVVIVNSRNITERKRATQKLKEKKSQLMNAQQIARVGSWEWIPGADAELRWSKEMCRIYGIEPQDFDHSYQTFIGHIHKNDRKRVEKIIERAFKTHEPFEFENRIITDDGEERVLLCRGEAVVDNEGNVIKMLGTGLDITERKEKEEKLRKYSEQLRNLSARIQDAREEERTRISREIHDELGQTLTVLKMEISMVFDNMKHNAIPDDVQEEVESELQSILNRINVIIKSVQRIASELRPEVLDDLGLEEAIDWQAAEFEKRTGIDINFETNGTDTEQLTDEQATTLFRVFQETLTNVYRHAEATTVDIELRTQENNLQLIVHDDGKGIKNAERDDPSSLGIISMRERTELLGGDVKIYGKEGKGTTIELTIPLN